MSQCPIAKAGTQDDYVAALVTHRAAPKKSALAPRELQLHPAVVRWT